MSKSTTIKVYFNNGCTTLLYNDQTTVEDIIRVVIKGRLSLNELRYKKCFQLRSTRFSKSNNDFDPLFSPTNSTSTSTANKSSSSSSSNGNGNEISLANIPIIEEYFWLRNSLRIKEWIQTIKSQPAPHNDLDFWKLQLRVRFISNDLNEIQFKDPITFNYYYEQIKNDFILYVAPSIRDSSLMPNLLDLGCLEMRRAYQNMNPNTLDKKINYDYLERDVGLKRFFPDLVLQQKAKSIKKMIIKGIKVYENLNEAECMLKYLEKLKYLWKYNEESFKCFLGTTWGVPITVAINYENSISWYMNNNTKEAIKNAEFERIVQIVTECDDENQRDGILKLKILDAKELLTFKFQNLREAENMASLINGYCQLKTKRIDSIWNADATTNTFSSHAITSYTNSKLIDLGFITPQLNHRKLANNGDPVVFRTPPVNSVHILSEPDEHSFPQLLKSVEDQQQIIKKLKHNELNKNALSCFEKLGSGQFGDVYRGTYRTNDAAASAAAVVVEVAIKRFKFNHEDSLDATEQTMLARKFMKEARIMEQFDHPHIIKLIGVTSESPLQIVMELAKFGQLRNYLQANKDHLETSTLLLYCYQLSTAMEYLESKKFVHRDIAARNVLVVNHECVKLADFGLSRQIDDNNIYLSTKCKLPIKWMAPESINFRKFTSLSDAWMFGVCMWEILSYGEKPFQGIKNPDVIKLIEEKKRLACPKNCPEELYYLMLKCWEYDSTMRLGFTELKSALKLIYASFKAPKSSSSSEMIPASMTTSTLKSTNDSEGSGGADADNSSSSLIVTSPNKITKRNYIPPFRSPISIGYEIYNSSNGNGNQSDNLSKISYIDSINESEEESAAADLSSSNMNDKFKHLNLSDGRSDNNDPSALNKSNVSAATTTTTTSTNNKDLILRDQTLAFIQNISFFVRSLNNNTTTTTTPTAATNGRQNVDREFNEIRSSLKRLIATIKSLDSISAAAQAGQHGGQQNVAIIMSKLRELDEELLMKLIQEYNSNQLEKVINVSLDMARLANELFHLIANVPDISPSA